MSSFDVDNTIRIAVNITQEKDINSTFNTITNMDTSQKTPLLPTIIFENFSFSECNFLYAKKNI